MSFHNEDDDELTRAIEASLQDMRNQSVSSSLNNELNNEFNNENKLECVHDIETISDDDDEDDDEDEDEVEAENELNTNLETDNESELNDDLNLALEQQLTREPSLNNDINNDDELTIALQASLVDYHKTEEQLLNEIQEKSLQTIEDDKQRKLQREKEDDEIMAKIVKESYESNIALQKQSNRIINNVNDYENDEEQYMTMILNQIKEEEEREVRESRATHHKQTQLLIQEQDLEYEEALRKDIAKEQKKKSKSVSVNVSVSETIEKPLTKEEIRKARLSFYEKK